MSKQLKVTNRGWAGHFICAHRCRFRLNTLIEYGDIRIVVSTVGGMEHPLKEGKFDTIGLNRHYETMAFRAKFDGTFWDADVQRQVYFDSEWAYPNLEDELAANDGHYKVVDEISEGLLAGDTYEN